MRESRLIMGMPVLLEIVDLQAVPKDYEAVFEYLTSVDERFSTYKEQSEISKINRGEITEESYSPDVKEVFSHAEETKRLTNGFFDIHTLEGSIDPSGIVKGWAIQNAAQLLREKGLSNFYIDVGGDIQMSGLNSSGEEWSIGIRNPNATSPEQRDEIVKVIYPHGKGVATSGSYLRGSHIYNPHASVIPADFVSLTVIGPNVYEADRFATAAFAMGMPGMHFLEDLRLEDGSTFEAYAIDSKGTAVFTSGFTAYTST